VLKPGITLAPWEHVSLSWDARWLHGVIVSKGFEDATRAYLLYVEVVDAKSPTQALPADGMTYLGLTPKLPFTPQVAIGMRSGCDLSDGYGPWCGVFRRDATGAFSQRLRLLPGHDVGGAAVFVAADKHTLSFRIPRAALGPAAQAPLTGTSAAKLRVVGHLVHGGAGDEWKDVLPPTATPWQAATTGYLEIDLAGAADAATWVQK
jgi:hypothetical protein